MQSGKKHRLENPGKILLEVIEVQLGEYLEENDIIRFEDDFGREWTPTFLKVEIEFPYPSW